MEDEPLKDYFLGTSSFGELHRAIQKYREEIIEQIQRKYPLSVDVKTVIGPRKLRIEPKPSLRDHCSCQVVILKGFEEISIPAGIVDIEISDEGEHRGLPNTRYLQVYGFRPNRIAERPDYD